MKKTNHLIIIALLVLVLGQSCKKQLNIPSRNSIDADIALSNRAGIDGALNSVYSILKRESHYGRDQFSIPEAMADVAFANGRSSRLVGENRNTSGSNITAANWTGSYGGINEINLILAAIPKVSDAITGDKERWEGELKFLRAFLLFDLVRNFSYIPTYTVPAQDKGGVVINLVGFNNPVDAAAYFPARSSVAQCYAQIMKDLYEAIPLLAANGRAATGSIGTNYASKHAALALGSRIRLYEGNWAKADSFATAAIALTGGLGAMTNTGSYIAGWRNANHPEAIFQVWYATLGENIGQNTSLAATHTTLPAPGAYAQTRQGQGDLVPNAFLLNQLGISGFPANLTASSCLSTNPATCPVIILPPTLTYSNDIRNKLFEWGANSSGHYIECTKWLGKNGSPNWDNTVVLRWPELYLNRAEARYKMSNEAGAWADLNVIRLARYTGFVVPGVQDFTGQALLDEILRQRMLEFAFEGMRFYDLKRYGLNIVKSNPVVNLPPTDFRLLPRVPQTDVDGNPNMVQNFGY
jgi:starch-binding outer membrane protein, SusD/RagB family